MARESLTWPQDCYTNPAHGVHATKSLGDVQELLHKLVKRPSKNNASNGSPCDVYMHLINGFPNPWRSGVWLGNPLSLVFLVTFVNALPWTDEFMGVGNPAPAACFPCAPRIPLKLWKHYLPVLRILPSIPRSHVLLCWNCAPCKPHAHQCHPRTAVPQMSSTQTKDISSMTKLVSFGSGTLAMSVRYI